MIGQMMRTGTITGAGLITNIEIHRHSGGMNLAIPCVNVFQTSSWNEFMTVIGMTDSQDYIPIGGMIATITTMGIIGIEVSVSAMQYCSLTIGMNWLV